MADDEQNETTEPESTEADEQVPGTSSEAEVVAETPEEVPGTEAEAEAAETPEEVPVTAAKPARSRRHVPRSERRQRTKPKREAAAKRKPITRTPKPDEVRGRRQERRGVVVSDKGDKTIVVKVD